MEPLTKKLTMPSAIEELAARSAEGAPEKLIVMPTRNKFPKGLAGWQRLEKSYTGPLWKSATGFATRTGPTTGITIIDIDQPDREWFDALEDRRARKANHDS